MHLTAQSEDGNSLGSGGALSGFRLRLAATALASALAANFRARRSSNSRVKCQASMTALSRADPGLPTDWRMPLTGAYLTIVSALAISRWTDDRAGRPVSKPPAPHAATAPLRSRPARTPSPPTPSPTTSAAPSKPSPAPDNLPTNVAELRNPDCS